ncbi:MAG: HEAT repeat domain-containing protein, partial [Planctomycetota bacterium]
MMRVTFLLLAAILPATLSSAVAVAQDASPDKLIELLGHDEYNVREDATKKLIALGAAAIPALEKAVQDEDVEVRMRAGRALRSIREK